MKKLAFALTAVTLAGSPALAEQTRPAAPATVTAADDDLEPGCFRVLPGGLIYCLPMPI